MAGDRDTRSSLTVEFLFVVMEITIEAGCFFVGEWGPLILGFHQSFLQNSFFIVRGKGKEARNESMVHIFCLRGDVGRGRPAAGSERTGARKTPEKIKRGQFATSYTVVDF